MNMNRHADSERGIALITVLLLLMLSSAILAGFLVTTGTDVALRSGDRARSRALYAAHGGIEKLTADLGDLFATDFAPTRDDLDALQANPPVIEGLSFAASDGLGYTIAADDANADGNPDSSSGTVTSGPYEGFVGVLTPYQLWVTAHAADGSEVRLNRRLQTVSIPVFQFGIFSETDLSFFAGPDFNFGGRVHTNGNLFLAAGNGNTLRLSDKVTAFGEVIRTNLSNGWATATNYTGNVQPITAPGAFRSLLTNEGSLVATIGSDPNEPMWTNRSIGTYHGNIRSGTTGAKNLQLPLITVGSTPIDLIRRPTVGEAAVITGQRLYAQANVRILLSNTAAAITDLPNSSSTVAPIRLDTLASLAAGNANGVYSGAIQPAASSGVIDDGYRVGAGTPLIDGFLKVEYRNAVGDWIDVTAEVLDLGFTQRNELGGCADPSPDAIVRFQRVKTAPSTGAAAPAACAGALATDYWPLTLYDTREGKPRDNEAVTSANVYLSGVIHYTEFDVNNFRRWLSGTIGTSGGLVSNEDGFTVYFSDRRTNLDAADEETGEYGWEDIVNPLDANGAANNALDAGEDLNANNALDTYGGTPRFPAGFADVGAAVAGTTLAANEAALPLTTAARPWTAVTAAVAKANPAILFRRAVKLVNGAQGQLPVDGFNLTSENPAYVVGPFNATNAAFADPHAAAAIIADAVTLLSPNWTDRNSFLNPNNPGNRARTTTYYRFATIAGKNRSFPRAGTNCGGACFQDYGTDAGTHNFLRMLEGGGQTVNYRGSMASFHFSRQAVGIYKCCTNVYGAPTRAYSFDIEFLTPSLLPPKTPMFRDVNTTGFRQVTRRP